MAGNLTEAGRARLHDSQARIAARRSEATRQAVLDVLTADGRARRWIIAETGLSICTVRRALAALIADGRVERVGRQNNPGLRYRPTGRSPHGSA